MLRKMNSRERLLLIVFAMLLIGVLYYLLFYVPMQEKMTVAENDLITLQEQAGMVETRVARLDQMQEEVDQVFADAHGHPSRIANYDNMQILIQQLNGILSASSSYTIGFNALSTDESGSIVRRGVNLSFTCSSYAAAKQILQTLSSSQYRCLIGDISVNNGEGGCSVSAALTFFEYME